MSLNVILGSTIEIALEYRRTIDQINACAYNNDHRYEYRWPLVTYSSNYIQLNRNYQSSRLIDKQIKNIQYDN